MSDPTEGPNLYYVQVIFFDPDRKIEVFRDVEVVSLGQHWLILQFEDNARQVYSSAIVSECILEPQADVDALVVAGEPSGESEAGEGGLLN